MKWIQKITKITHELIYVLYCLYKKVLKSNPNSIVSLTPNLTEYFSTLRLSSKILHFVNIIHDILSKTFSIFYHSLHVWYHEILTNLMIFILCLLFYNLKARRPHVHGRVSWTRCSKFLFIPQVRPHTRLSNMNIIFPLILLYYLYHL